MIRRAPAGPALTFLLALVFALHLSGTQGPPTAARQAARVPASDLDEATITQLRDAMASGRYTARRLVELYTARIEAIDRSGPALRSVIELNPDALSIADALDAERRTRGVRGPLHGIPVLIKDNIDTADRMMTTAGSLALQGSIAARDSFVAARLRAAGAVILGKTNLSEWANIRSTRSTSGWSSRGGQTKNPYVLDRNPCGSSSGTASGISASLAAVGVGTETDGSILCPASVTGLVGLKPTVGLVSRSGIIPISISQDTAGPMTRTVADAALLLEGLAGVDPADPRGADGARRSRGGYTTFLDTGALKGKRFGLLRQAMGYHPDVDASVERASTILTSAGALVLDVRIGTYNSWNEAELDVLLHEFKDGLNRYLKESGAPIASLEALIAWNKEHAHSVMPFFGQELFEQAQAKGPLTEASYLTARETARRRAAGSLMTTLEANGLDAIIAPTMSPAWLTDYLLGDHFVGAGYAMAAVAGTPSITVPISDARGLPLGLTFMGRAYSEGELIGFAFALEQLTKSRRPPTFMETLVTP
jgi:amidase